jgi:hypothetical protein
MVMMESNLFPTRSSLVSQPVLIQIPSATIQIEHGQMLGVAIACGRCFVGLSYCPFTVHFVPKTDFIRWNGLKQAKRLTARVDSKHAGLALTA